MSLKNNNDSLLYVKNKKTKTKNNLSYKDKYNLLINFVTFNLIVLNLIELI